MESYFTYLLLATTSISVLYLAYRLFLRKEMRFQQLRIFLLFSMVLSLILPFSKINLSIGTTAPQVFDQILVATETPIVQTANYEVEVENYNSKTRSVKKVSWKQLFVFGYVLGLLFFVLRIIFFLGVIVQIAITSKKNPSLVNVYSHKKLKHSFTFLNRIYIPDSISNRKEQEEIITHEKIHASQLHSIDIIIIELLSAVMWFNPLVWMMRKSVQLVHEYLADEGVLSTGADKLRYQALLVNQIAEERLICLSSGFNHSLIKKRMIMMTKNKGNTISKNRIWILAPLTVMLFIGIACVNNQENSEPIAAIAPAKMNVLYLGVDNPMYIAVSGYSSEDLEVSIDQGDISGKDGYYQIRPEHPGLMKVTVSADGKEVQTATFRVKVVPDPIPSVNGKKGGEITKATLLETGELSVMMENFDFDVSFKITQFTLSTTHDGFVKEASSKSNKFTTEQQQIIKNANASMPGSMVGERIYFQDIKCVGPDGKIRNMPAIMFKIIE